MPAVDDPRSAAQRALPLVEAIFEAAVDPARWNAFVCALSEEMGGAAVAMSLAFPGAETAPEYYRARLRPEFVTAFERHLRNGLPWGPLTDPLFREGFGWASRRFPDARLPDTEHYREYMQPQGLAAQGPLAHLIRAGTGRPLAGISIMRRMGDRPIDEDDVAVCNLLVPHLARAYDIRRQLRSTRREHEIRAEVLDRIPTGMLVVDAGRRVIAMNRAASELLSLRDGLEMDGEVVRARDQRDDAALDQQIRAAVCDADPDERASGALAVRRPSRQPAFGVLVSPLLAYGPQTRVGDRVASVIINDPARFGPGQGWFDTSLQASFGLTPAETSLVHLLADGRSLEQISDERSVSIHTTRSQLKRVFAKTGTGRQSDLVRLALAKVAAVRSD